MLYIIAQLNHLIYCVYLAVAVAHIADVVFLSRVGDIVTPQAALPIAAADTTHVVDLAAPHNTVAAFRRCAAADLHTAPLIGGRHGNGEVSSVLLLEREKGSKVKSEKLTLRDLNNLN